MSDISERIAAWEADGLIDRATADRLRDAEAGRPELDDLHDVDDAVAAPTRDQLGEDAPAGSSQVAAMFGPSVTIPEVFGYLGTAFLFAGWTAWASRTTFASGSVAPGLASLFAAGVLIALGVVLRRGDARRSRAAGVAFLVAVAYAGAGFAALAGSISMSPEQAGLIGSGVALAIAVALRRLQPAVLTQIGLLASITVFAATALALAQATFLPARTFSYDDLGKATLIADGTDPMLLVIASAVWWLSCAVVIGLIGLLEARAAERGDAAAARRAAISRFWAGIVAVVGLAWSVSRSDVDTASGDFRRVVEPWIGQLSLLIVSLVLLERAFRRDATAYVYAAALGLILALSDFNVSYLSDSAEVALVIEGAILLGVGLAADRLRRRIGRGAAGHPPPVTASDAASDDSPATDAPASAVGPSST